MVNVERVFFAKPAVVRGLSCRIHPPGRCVGATSLVLSRSRTFSAWAAAVVVMGACEVACQDDGALDRWQHVVNDAPHCEV